MKVDPERLARALAAHHLQNSGQAPWGELHEEAREAYRQWAKKVAALYDRTQPDEGGEDEE